MTEQASAGEPSKEQATPMELRAKREAEALRENLLKRKAQSRARQAVDEERLKPD